MSVLALVSEILSFPGASEAHSILNNRLTRSHLLAILACCISAIRNLQITNIQGKVHGSLARAGKVKSQTPKQEKTEKAKLPKGRAYKRLLYTKRFVNKTLDDKKRKSNSNSA